MRMSLFSMSTMEPSHFMVSFLGSPSIACGGRTIRLRSETAWAVLAWLLVPDHGDSLAPKGQPVSRQAIADCIWDGSKDPLHALRQVLLSFIDVLGSEAFQIDRGFVTAREGYFCTDLQIIERQLKLAEALPHDAHSERVEVLVQADLHVTGQFLELCSLTAPAANTWLGTVRSRTMVLTERMLRLLYAAHVGCHNPHAAFEVLMRLCTLRPEKENYKTRLLELGKRIDRPLLLEQLRATDPFETLLPEVRIRENRGQKLAGRDARAFSTVLSGRISGLPAYVRNRLFALSVLDAPFNNALAREACSASSATLSTLCDHHLLDRHEAGFRMLNAVQELCVDRLAPSSRLLVEEARRQFCCIYLFALYYGTSDATSYFTSIEEARPHLLRAVKYTASLPATIPSNTLYNLLRACGEIGIASELTEWAERVMGGYACSAEQIAYTAHITGWLFAEKRDYSTAITWLRSGAEHASDGSEVQHSLLGQLICCLHYNGQHQEALEASFRLEEIYQREGALAGLAGNLRFRAEIYLALDNPETAIHCLVRTEEMYRGMSGVELGIANCRYWIAEIQRRRGLTAEAEQNIRTSLELRLDHEDITGQAQSLICLARIAKEKGDLLSARLHLRNSLYLLGSDRDQKSRQIAEDELHALEIKESSQASTDV
jgi:DNA-binding SARP family transcriptional activator/tetratricopeptide (TPR) repeat protein